MQCLDTIIGISKVPCSCFSDPESETFNVTESTSGLYLDELVSVDLANNTDCSETGPWKILNGAIESANVSIKTDISKALSRKYRTRHYGSSGNLGTRDIVTATFDHAYRGVKITGENIEGSYMKITHLSFFSSAAETFTAMLLDENSDELYSEEITATQTNKWVEYELTEPWIIALWVSGDKEPFYYLVHDSTSTKENSRPCTCSAGNKTKSWADVCDIDGTYSEDLSTFHSTTNMGAMKFKMETYCNVEFEVCSLVGDDRLMLAKAIQLNAAAKAIERILMKNISGFASQVSTEVLQAQLEGYASQYASTLNHLVEVILPGNCYMCDNNTPRRKSLL